MLYCTYYMYYMVMVLLHVLYGMVRTARNLFKRALSISSTSVHTLHAWAQLEKDEGNYLEAQRLLEQALIAVPEGRAAGGRKDRRGSSRSMSTAPPPERYNSSRILQSIAEVVELQGLQGGGKGGGGRINRDRVRRVFREGEEAAVTIGDAGFFQVRCYMYAVLYYTMLCCTMLYYTMVCYTILWYAILYYTMLCYSS
jgi:tetratricopeptide (TPR) repeat protein